MGFTVQGRVKSLIWSEGSATTQKRGLLYSLDKDLEALEGNQTLNADMPEDSQIKLKNRRVRFS